MLPGRHLHAFAWWAAALLWGAAAHRALGRSTGAKPPASAARRATLCLATVAAVLLGARLHFLLPAPTNRPSGIGGLLEIARSAAAAAVGNSSTPTTPGLRIGGGLAAAVALLAAAGPRWLGRTVPRTRLLDAVAPPAGVAIAIGRLGCFAEGCCFGIPCDLPWCLRWPRASPSWWSQVALGRISERAATPLPAHPYPLYLAGAALLATIAGRRLGRATGIAGSTAFTFAAVLSGSRLALEPLRESAFGQGAAGQQALDLLVLGGSIGLLACLVYRGTEGATAAARSPARQASSPSPGIPDSCTRRPSAGSSKAGSRRRRRQTRQASAEDSTRTG